MPLDMMSRIKCWTKENVGKEKATGEAALQRFRQCFSQWPELLMPVWFARPSIMVQKKVGKLCSAQRWVSPRPWRPALLSGTITWTPKAHLEDETASRNALWEG
jgi:hypothetical protein